ncbi:heavy metal translocating P-type ATPase, partial [Patescibacteria group bacterium]|nr:heavy metal translocating P-type ATPase [Patescibacteria group bacterium]
MDHKNHNQHSQHGDMNMKMDPSSAKATTGGHSAHENHSEHNGYNKPSSAKATAGKHAGHSTAMFKKRFYISLILTVPVLALSPLVQDFLNFSLTFAGDKYLLFLISSVIFFYGGWPFLNGAKNEIKSRAIGMMTLISLAISVAYFYSTAVVFGLAGEIFFWELATLIDIMLLGHWIEMKSVMGASMALEKLSALIPDNAHLLKNKDTVEIKTSELKDGDIILVKPGEKIP